MGATAIQHVVGMNQVHVAHAYRRARQVNLLHPAKQEPGQVQIANRRDTHADDFLQVQVPEW